MSYNQGYLVIVKIKKDARSEVQLLPFDVLCEYFTLIPIGSTFLVMSMHSDGSLTLSSPQRPTKAML